MEIKLEFGQKDSEWEREREREIQTDRQRERERYRQTDRQRETERQRDCFSLIYKQMKHLIGKKISGSL